MLGFRRKLKLRVPPLISFRRCHGAENSSHLKGSTEPARARRCGSWRPRCAKAGIKSLRRASRAERSTGEKIRKVLLDSGTAGLDPLAEMALMFASRAQHIAEVIEPADGGGRDCAVRPVHGFDGGLSGKRADDWEAMRCGSCIGCCAGICSRI